MREAASLGCGWGYVRTSVMVGRPLVRGCCAVRVRVRVRVRVKVRVRIRVRVRAKVQR